MVKESDATEKFINLLKSASKRSDGDRMLNYYESDDEEINKS